MSDERVWNDESRDDLKVMLRWVILGELRLARRDHQEILENSCAIHIQDECPEDERPEFMQFAADELRRAVARLADEQSTWAEETDCDRLDRVEAALRDRGIVLWQASPCCDTCTGAELGDRVHAINDRYPGFDELVRGYTFFIDQNLPEQLSDSSLLSVYLGYGWFSPGGSQMAPELYEKKALGIAREVCECLRDEGFEVDWDGSFSRKIGLSLNWQRRTMLE